MLLHEIYPETGLSILLLIIIIKSAIVIIIKQHFIGGLIHFSIKYIEAPDLLPWFGNKMALLGSYMELQSLLSVTETPQSSKFGPNQDSQLTELL